MDDPEDFTLDKVVEEAEANGRVFIGLVTYDVANDQLCLAPNALIDRNEIDAILRKFDMTFQVIP